MEPPPPATERAHDARPHPPPVHLPGPTDEQAHDYPQKRFFRSRAHCNPLSHNDAAPYPRVPSSLDWAALYPARDANLGNKVAFLDVGCGFGGLCVALSILAPDKLTLALEIRPKVAEFVSRRIDSLRRQHPGSYQNAACMRYNAMINLPNLIPKSSLEKLFFCFPDPPFKTKNHRRRIVSEALLAEYAYALKMGGLLYAITDVGELHKWHVARLEAHACFERVDIDDDDAYVAAITQTTEEGKKVARQGGHMKDGSKYAAVYRRVAAPAIVGLWPG